MGSQGNDNSRSKELDKVAIGRVDWVSNDSWDHYKEPSRCGR